MLFYLTTLNLMRFLTEDPPQLSEDKTDAQAVNALDDWNHEGMVLSETFQVAAIIEKLPPAWRDFKNYLKHKRKEMNVEELVVKLRIEENNKNSEKKWFNPKVAKSNVIEHGQSSKEVNLVGSNPNQWWIDTGATRHVCSNKEMFSTFEAVENGEKLYTGNSATSNIKGQGNVVLKMTSGKELTLTNVLYVPDTDVCDLKSTQTRGGNKYFITFIDDNTKYCYVYLLKSKDEAIEKFILYKNEVENQLNKKIKVLRNDRGGEYESPFAEFCAQHGIRHETTAPYSPQQNGIAERKNRTLKEHVGGSCLNS
ncbi:hypothetical protein DH2020_020616 [Rehmannia glutinosa]|uniref:Integrase catalytic domain-containing protein n=1 Tax=Rehmannia glutinosa TaxID=99300 RepID=A0ABR0WGQ8_REHGL